jgi:hypothetical protein
MSLFTVAVKGCVWEIVIPPRRGLIETLIGADDGVAALAVADGELRLPAASAART